MRILDHFSHRSKMILFLTRKDAGRRGARALQPNHLLDAIIREDQGELARRVGSAVTTAGPIRPPRPFFSAETAEKILRKIEHGLPKAEPVLDSMELLISAELEVLMTSATALAKELHHSSVEPLHLTAAMLAQENSQAAETLKDGGISREAVMAALRQ